MDSWQSSITVIASIASAAFALLCREGLTAWLKWKADKRIDITYEDEKLKSGYEKLAASHASRISVLEQLLLQSQAEHIKCVETQAGLKVQVSFQQQDITRLTEEKARQQIEIDKQQSEINELRERLDKYDQP